MNSLEMYKRQVELLNPESISASIAIVGAGAIGSFTAFLLSREGLYSTCIDDDRVEEHNIPTTIYRMSEKGRYKVMALHELCPSVSPKVQRIGDNDELCYDIVISAVDSFKSRRCIAGAALRGGAKLLVDGRIGENAFNVYAVRLPDGYDAYLATLPADDATFALEEFNVAARLRCGAEAIADIAAGCAALIVRSVRSYLTGKPFPVQILEYNYERFVRFSQAT